MCTYASFLFVDNIYASLLHYLLPQQLPQHHWSSYVYPVQCCPLYKMMLPVCAFYVHPMGHGSPCLSRAVARGGGADATAAGGYPEMVQDGTHVAITPVSKQCFKAIARCRKPTMWRCWQATLLRDRCCKSLSRLLLQAGAGDRTHHLQTAIRDGDVAKRPHGSQVLQANAGASVAARRWHGNMCCKVSTRFSATLILDRSIHPS